jgi:hypothetical protein
LWPWSRKRNKAGGPGNRAFTDLEVTLINSVLRDDPLMRGAFNQCNASRNARLTASPVVRGWRGLFGRREGRE